MHSDMRGISVVGGDVVLDGKRNLIASLSSHHGDVAGLDLMENGLFEVEEGAALLIEDLQSGSEMTEKVYAKLVSINKTPYPNNFDVCSIHLQDNSMLVGMDPSQYEECRVPEFMQSSATPQPRSRYPDQDYPDFSVIPSTGPTVEPTNEPILDSIGISTSAESADALTV